MEPPVYVFVVIVFVCVSGSLQDQVLKQERHDTPIEFEEESSGFVGAPNMDTKFKTLKFSDITFVGEPDSSFPSIFEQPLMLESSEILKPENYTFTHNETSGFFGVSPPPKDTSSSTPALMLHSNQTIWYLQGPISTKVIPALYILVLAVGLPANLFTLISLASKVRKVSSALLYCSLALSDLLLLLSLVLKTHYHLHGNHWQFGEGACRLVTACFYGNLYCSAQTLACITVSRYLAIARPITYKSLPKTSPLWVTLVLWLVFGAALVPDLLFRQSYWIPQLKILTCHDILPLYHSHRFILYFSPVLTVLGLLFPLVVLVVCYVRVLNKLKRSRFDWSLYIRSSSLVFLIFLLCFTPAGVLHFIHTMLLFAGGTEDLYMYFNVAVCLCCLHAAIDPFLFMLMSRSMRTIHYSRAKTNV